MRPSTLPGQTIALAPTQQPSAIASGLQKNRKPGSS
jgi:hypothetical protein